MRKELKEILTKLRSGNTEPRVLGVQQMHWTKDRGYSQHSVKRGRSGVCMAVCFEITVIVKWERERGVGMYGRNS